MRGQRFSEDIRWSLIRTQHHGLDNKRAPALTGVSEQQVCLLETGYRNCSTQHIFFVESTVFLRKATLANYFRNRNNLV